MTESNLEPLEEPRDDVPGAEVSETSGEEDHANPDRYRDKDADAPTDPEDD